MKKLPELEIENDLMITNDFINLISSYNFYLINFNLLKFVKLINEMNEMNKIIKLLKICCITRN